jgi:hypothetical protein
VGEETAMSGGVALVNVVPDRLGLGIMVRVDFLRVQTVKP